MGNWDDTKEAYYGAGTDRAGEKDFSGRPEKTYKAHITCVTPEFPYCPLCPYGLVEPEEADLAYGHTDIRYFKVFCMLNNRYV